MAGAGSRADLCEFGESSDTSRCRVSEGPSSRELHDATGSLSWLALGRAAITRRLAAAKISGGALFRCVCRADKWWGEGITEKAVWHVVKNYSRKLALFNVAPHDLRTSCAKFCHAA